LNVEFKNDLLNDYAKLLIKNGYKVYTSKDNFSSGLSKSYFFFVKDDKIGYIQAGSFFEGVTFSSVHKPCRECGTGFRLSSEEIHELDLKYCEEAINTIAPNWSRKDAKYVVKYKDWIEKTKNYTSLEYVEVVEVEEWEK